MQEAKELLGFGNFLRSAEMEYVSVIMQEHLAHDCLEKLGSLGTVQFTDLNGDLTAFKRYYTPSIRRCDELEKKLRFFEEEMRIHGIIPENISQGEFTVWRASQMDTVHRDHRGMSILDYWDAIISERYRDYQSVKVERDKTAAALYQAVQRRFVIERAAEFFALERDGSEINDNDVNSNVGGTGIGTVSIATNSFTRTPRAGGNDEADDMTFKHIAGILATEDKVRFARIIFRASFGQAVVRFADIPVEVLDEKGDPHNKSVFAVFYRGRTLSSKLDRICTAFSASLHDIPNFAKESEVAAALEETRAAIAEGMAWLDQERQTSTTALVHLGILVRKWRMGIQREKAIYHCMNMSIRNPERGSLESQGWVLKTATASVQEAIRQVHVTAAAGGRVQPFYFEVQTGSNLHTPPTHFPTNKFTKAFQGFVNTYGIPRYGEANPALWAIITFPFLFGVMFGDIGHALILTLVSAWVVWSEDNLSKRKLGEMTGMIFKGRYMLLLMGIFSVYCGAIYNDVFSLGATPYKSAWSYVAGSRVAHWSGKPEDVYPFGIDPEWHLSENDLLFFNSLKMKLSVVLGITQMTFGLFLKTANAIHFRNNIDLLCECIPQIIFMVGLFGYMIALIVLKWSINWHDDATRPGAPPSLIDTMINIVLKPGVVNDGMYAGQAGFQTVLLLVVFITVPIMLVVKPYLVHRQNKAAHSHEEKSALLTPDASHHAGDAAGTAVTAGHGGDSHSSSGGHGGGHEQHGFGELFIHQAIETIEFVLGSVSNTASYLRLWALSLAHSQLATVFWERALVATVEMNSAVYVIVGYAMFSGITMAVLLLMDVLECYLHALRLHWVEFQNKFYKADGYKFTPFSFQALAEAAMD